MANKLPITPAEEKADINELIIKAKKKGTLDSDEILEVIEANALTDEETDKLYSKLEELGIEVTVPDIPDDLPDFENFDDTEEPFDPEEDMDSLLSNDAMPIEDHVKMYLKDIGKINILSAEYEI